MIRVGGYEWLLLFPKNPVRQLKAIADNYSAKEMRVTIRWCCIANKKFRTPKQVEVIKQAILRRGIKICYLAINNASELAEKSAIALYNSSFSHSCFPVNILMNI